ncbi:hypothetical protein DSC45_18885 [Streptomyces sp. YIM 130001]|nr:hypothetical protein DSC45_18885 [Streptomyces sp. YIM 130001]
MTAASAVPQTPSIPDTPVSPYPGPHTAPVPGAVREQRSPR